MIKRLFISAFTGLALSAGVVPAMASTTPVPVVQGVVSPENVSYAVNKSVEDKPVVRRVKYRVRKGQSLSVISKLEYGHARDWPVLYYANHLHSTVIYPHQKLRVPTLPRHIPRQPVFTVARTVAPATTTVHASHSPAPANSPAPVSSGIYSYAALEQLWVSAGGPSSAEAQAATIAECESGGNPEAYNPSGASGLWQILGAVVPGDLFNPSVNAANAVSKFTASGDTFAQWVCQ